MLNLERKVQGVQQDIGRYLARPAIAEYKILGYDGENCNVLAQES